MIVIRLLPVIVSFGILAAHFSRAGLLPLVIFSIAVPLLLFIRRAWVARSIQVLLLIVVALLTALSGLVFRGGSLKKRYQLKK